jgi:hypothetical protein
MAVQAPPQRNLTALLIIIKQERTRVVQGFKDSINASTLGLVYKNRSIERPIKTPLIRTITDLENRGMHAWQASDGPSALGLNWGV